MKKTILMALAVVLALAFGSAVLAASLVMVEDFEGYALGTNLIGGVGGWDTVNPCTEGYVAPDPVSPSNQVGYFRRYGAPITPTAGRYRALGANTIPDGASGEFSIRFLFNALPNSVFGLSCLPNPGPPSGTGAGRQLSVLFRLDNSAGQGRLIYMTNQGTSTGPTLASSLTSNTWYQVWATVDNATDTVSNIYLQGGADFPTKTLVNAGPLSFNIWATVHPNHTDLLTFFVFEQGYTAGVYLDEIQIGVVSETEGPVTSNVVAYPTPAPGGVPISLTANVDDSTTGGSNIASAEYNVDGGDWNPMSAQDSAFDEVSEDVTATIPAFAETGEYEVCVRGTAALGNIGDQACIFLFVDADGPITSLVVAGPNPAPVDSNITLTAHLDDSTTGNSNIASAEYSLDGVLSGFMDASDGNFDSPTEDVTQTFPAPSAGVYDLCVRGTDAVGNDGAPECIFLAVYDPAAGFVTGGGWINSPAGAYTADPSLTGKATFGFVSKYQKGANTPTGETEFQFKVASLNFHSSSYDWLVIAGARAQYKGTGTINGTGNYGFMLTAIDGQLNGGGGTDKFRIKIWDKATDAIVYDNMLGASDTGDPTTVLGGGSIVIHKK